MNDKELTKKLRKLAELNSKAALIQHEIYEHSVNRYGFDPSVLDNDEYLDSCTGANGVCNGMNAKEFHKSMIDAMEITGIDTEGL